MTIVGGGIGGLSTALAMARSGHPVLLLERDVLPPDDIGPEAAFEHPRTGTPQARHTHGLLARLTRVLRDRFPDLLDDLEAAGAHLVPLGESGVEPHPDDADLAVILVRRTTLELVLRRAVDREPGIEVRGGVAVAGLMGTTDHDRSPNQDQDQDQGRARTTVTGVRLADGTVIDATSVIVTTGRRSAVPDWLAELGVEVPETEHDTHLLYLTRWYRTAATEAHLNPKAAGDLGDIKFLAVPGDGDTFSITIACDSRDKELRTALLDPEVYDRAARRLPIGATFEEIDLVPISDVELMGGLVNRLRRFVDADGAPLVEGFHAVGDAHTCTNPFYGRGCSLAFVQATLLADAFADHPDDAAARSVAYEDGSRREVEPWYDHSVLLDGLFGRSDARTDTPRDDEDPDAAMSGIEALMSAAATDPVIGRAIMRVFNLLLRPDQLMTDPEFVERAMAIFADPGAHPRVTLEGPTRAELLALRAA